MDKVISRNTHFKRVLEKQLDDIELRQRQSEARRLKEIRDLGVDLSRIKKTSHDLEYGDDFPSRRHGQRRGSLPALDTSGDLSVYLNSSKPPRSRRRYSCIETIPMASPEEEEHARTISSTPEETLPEKDTQLPSVKTRSEVSSCTPASAGAEERRDNAHKNLISIPTINPTKSFLEKKNIVDAIDTNSTTHRVRRGSLDATENIEKDSNHRSHNVTTVFVHEDIPANPKEKAQSEEGDLDAESQSMFQMVRNRGRRASEPAVGGFFIRHLQASAFNDILSLQQRNTTGGEELKKSIQANLPSNIVAEKDEDEKDSEDVNVVTEDMSRPSQQKFMLSSIFEHDQDGDYQKYSSLQQTASSADKNKTLHGNHFGRKTGSSGYRPRRNSDGDVLSYSYAKKLQEAKNQVRRSNGTTSASTNNKQRFENTETDKDEIWDAVRKCRYLRGGDSPDISETTDVAEFVFGHSRKDALPPSSTK